MLILKLIYSKLQPLVYCFAIINQWSWYGHDVIVIASVTKWNKNLNKNWNKNWNKILGCLFSPFGLTAFLVHGQISRLFRLGIAQIITYHHWLTVDRKPTWWCVRPVTLYNLTRIINVIIMINIVSMINIISMINVTILININWNLNFKFGVHFTGLLLVDPPRLTSAHSWWLWFHLEA